MVGESDLSKLIAGMRPVLDPAVYCFATLPTGQAVSGAPLMRFQEAEGDTVIVPRDMARRDGLDADRPFRRITLSVHSDLEAVGLTAAFSNALAAVGISANVVAGYFHDHIFVPEGDAEKALKALQDLAAG